MSGILLGALAYSGINNNKSGIDNNKLNSKQKLNNIYNSDIENNMNSIERLQASSQYARQFDELRFDNINGPRSEMSTNTGYTEFSNSNMDYNIVSREHFTHNNMVPSTSRRDVSQIDNLQNNQTDRSQRKLETFTGISDTYVSKKEKLPLFEPMSDLSYVNGMPSITNDLQNRYLPSNKNNFGNLPFENSVKIRPGVGDEVQEGKYAVYRVDYKNVDDLRPETNKKVSYESKPLETIKKGEMRGRDPNLTKFKLPDFREQNLEHLIASRSVIEAHAITGKFTDMNTFRGDKQNYTTGPAINSNIGSAPNTDKTKFQDAKKESYKNDNERGISNINNKPVMLNTGSYSNNDNHRTYTNQEYKGNINVVNGLYIKDYKDIPEATLKEIMLNGNTNIGISGPIENKSYAFSKDLIMPLTNRQLYEDKNPILNFSTDVKKNIAVNPNDIAKYTMRQDTSHSLAINVVPNENYTYSNLNDKAKETIKSMNIYEIKEQNIKGMNNDTYSNLNDKAKETIKSMNMYEVKEQNIKGMYNDTYSNLNDKAKETIKSINMFEIKEQNIKGRNNDSYSNLNDKAKETIKSMNMFEVKEQNIKGMYNDIYSNLNDIAKLTIKSMNIHEIKEQNVKGMYNDGYSNLTDNAKPTIKQSTVLTKQIGNIKSSIQENGYTRDEKNVAKTTNKQMIEQTKHIGHVNAVNHEEIYARDEKDIARTTIKQTTEVTKYIAQPDNSNTHVSYSIHNDDKARPTIKQATIIKTYNGPLTGEISHQISHEASNNMLTNDCREITANFNRNANGKADANGPILDRGNVKLIDKITYSYTPNPLQSLDNSVMPSVAKYPVSKVVENSDYYINPNFINTLKNNPLVNDIYHPKNE